VVRRKKIQTTRIMQAKPRGTQGTALLGGGMLLSACTIVGPDFKRPEVPWLDAWSGGSLESLSSEQGGERQGRIEEWWRTFNDLVLNRLITEGYC
jgi:multidrug efflux system outer membrane protein